MGNKTITQLTADSNEADLVENDIVVANRNGVDIKAIIPKIATLDSNDKIPLANMQETNKWVLDFPGTQPDNSAGEYSSIDAAAIVPFNCKFKRFQLYYNSGSANSYTNNTYVNIQLWTANIGTINISDTNCRQQIGKQPRPLNRPPNPSTTLPYYSFNDASSLDSVQFNTGSATNRVSVANFRPQANEIMRFRIAPQSPSGVYWRGVLVFEEVF